MKIKDYKCKCGCDDFFFSDNGNQTGIYCSRCGMWIKWADKNERNLRMKQEPCEDAISRQAILGIIHFEDNWLYDTQSHNANTVIAFSGLKSKVKALPSVNPQEQESVIDKIRAEIEQERIGYPPSADYYKAIMKCLQIIDKYKESEDKE